MSKRRKRRAPGCMSRAGWYLSKNWRMTKVLVASSSSEEQLTYKKEEQTNKSARLSPNAAIFIHRMNCQWVREQLWNSKFIDSHENDARKNSNSIDERLVRGYSSFSKVPKMFFNLCGKLVERLKSNDFSVLGLPKQKEMSDCRPEAQRLWTLNQVQETLAETTQLMTYKRQHRTFRR